MAQNSLPAHPVRVGVPSSSARGSRAGHGPLGFLHGRSKQGYGRAALFTTGTAAVVPGRWNLNGAAVYMDDEITYTAQVFSVLEGHLAPYTYRHGHPPLGWTQLEALA